MIEGGKLLPRHCLVPTTLLDGWFQTAERLGFSEFLHKLGVQREPEDMDATLVTEIFACVWIVRALIQEFYDKKLKLFGLLLYSIYVLKPIQLHLENCIFFRDFNRGCTRD